MKIVAIVGTGSGSGKTTVACRLLEAVPGLGAIKISPRDAEGARVERGRGVTGKDTDSYAAAGAVRVARIVAPRGQAPAGWREIEAEFQGLPGVIVEGAGSLELPGSKFVVLVADSTFLDRRERNTTIASKSDVIVINVSTGSPTIADLKDAAPHLDASRIVLFQDGLHELKENWQPLVSLVAHFLNSGSPSPPLAKGERGGLPTPCA